MNAPLTVAGKRSNRARTEIGSLTGGGPPTRGSGSLLPRAQVVPLLGRERVDLHPHRVLVHVPTDPPHATSRELRERILVDLDVEVTRVREDRAVLHDLEVLAP